MVKKNSAVSEPEDVRRGKFVTLPIALLLDVKARAIEDTRKLGHPVTETDVIQSALEKYLK